jgi:hypothetical protein
MRWARKASTKSGEDAEREFSSREGRGNRSVSRPLEMRKAGAVSLGHGSEKDSLKAAGEIKARVWMVVNIYLRTVLNNVRRWWRVQMRRPCISGRENGRTVHPRASI